MLCNNCGYSEYDHQAGQTCPVGGTLFQRPNDRFSYRDARPGIEVSASVVPTGQINPKFHAALDRIREIHDKKSSDYANDANRYANFEQAAATAGCSVDTVFGVLIGVKLARLAELTKSGKIPNNESIQDTRLDLAVYSTLWLSYHEEI